MLKQKKGHSKTANTTCVMRRYTIRVAREKKTYITQWCAFFLPLEIIQVLFAGIFGLLDILLSIEVFAQWFFSKVKSVEVS